MSLLCEALYDGTESPSLTLEWRNSEGKLLSVDPNFRVTSDIRGNKVFLTAAFDMFTPQIEGEYSCTASLNLGTIGVNKTVTTLLRSECNLLVGSL